MNQQNTDLTLIISVVEKDKLSDLSIDLITVIKKHGIEDYVINTGKRKVYRGGRSLDSLSDRSEEMDEAELHRL